MKKVLIIIFVILILLFATCEPAEPESDMIPYMSDVVYIPTKVYAKGKPKRSKKKSLDAYEKLGTFTLTAYCGCSSCSGNWGTQTATGTKCEAGKTIAVDPKVIPYGTKVMINKHEYVAEDCGGAIKGRHIDIYFDNHPDAVEFGKQKATVYKRKEVRSWAQKKRSKIKLKSTLNILADGK